MDYLTPMEAAFEAFFDRWPDYPPEEVAESWRDSIEHAARAAIAALDQTQTGFCRNCGAVNPLDQPEPGEDCERCGGSGFVVEQSEYAPDDRHTIHCPDCTGTGKHPDPPGTRLCAAQQQDESCEGCEECLPAPDPPQVSDAAVELLAKRDYERSGAVLGPWPPPPGKSSGTDYAEAYREQARETIDALLPHLRPERGEEER